VAARAHAIVRAPSFGEHHCVRRTRHYRPAAGRRPRHFERSPGQAHPVLTHANKDLVSHDRADGIPRPSAESVVSFDLQAYPLERFDGHTEFKRW
jgi:hypothetical protein